VEQIPEWGLTANTLLSLQQSWADREGLAIMMGYINTATDVGNTGHSWGILTGGTQVTTNIESHSYSLPLLSGSIGVMNDRFVNVGRLKKLTASFTPAQILPLTVTLTSATAACTMSLVLSDFYLSLEMVDIGAAAQATIDKSLIDGKMYSHITTFKTTTSTVTASSGLQTLNIGLTASSCKSIFTTFYEQGTAGTTNSANGKYDSKNPGINSIGFNIAGISYPASGSLNPLLYPSQVFRNTQCAIGNFNSTQFKSAILPTYYQKLSVGIAPPSTTFANQADYLWTLGASASALCQFIYGENFEKIPKRGCISGSDLTFQKIQLVINTVSAPTNAHIAYIMGMFDGVLMHDTHTGDLIGIL
jgi:hypothetical protein